MSTVSTIDTQLNACIHSMYYDIMAAACNIILFTLTAAAYALTAALNAVCASVPPHCHVLGLAGVGTSRQAGGGHAAEAEGCIAVRQPFSI